MRVWHIQELAGQASQLKMPDSPSGSISSAQHGQCNCSNVLAPEAGREDLASAASVSAAVLIRSTLYGRWYRCWVCGCWRRFPIASLGILNDFFTGWI